MFSTAEKSQIFIKILLIEESKSKNELRNLPWLSFCWPTIAVYTHIDRVSSRTKLTMGKKLMKLNKSSLFHRAKKYL